MTQETELKPCPFCGNKPNYSCNGARYDAKGAEKRNGVLYQQQYGFGCTPCGIKHFVDVDDPFSEEARSIAKKAWNTRAEDPTKAELIRALESILLCENGIYWAMKNDDLLDRTHKALEKAKGDR